MCRCVCVCAENAKNQQKEKWRTTSSPYPICTIIHVHSFRFAFVSMLVFGKIILCIRIHCHIIQTMDIQTYEYVQVFNDALRSRRRRHRHRQRHRYHCRLLTITWFPYDGMCFVLSSHSSHAFVVVCGFSSTRFWGCFSR